MLQEYVLELPHLLHNDLAVVHPIVYEGISEYASPADQLPDPCEQRLRHLIQLTHPLPQLALSVRRRPLHHEDIQLS